MQSFNGPVAEIDLSRLCENYRSLRARFTGQECAAVVKANAYGLGVEAVARALAAAGCQTFFVASLAEGIELRAVLPDRKIAVFHGVGAGEALAFVNHRLVPVLNSPLQLSRWLEVSKDQADRPSILHVDTAMARLGLTPTEFAKVTPEQIDQAQVSLLMTHLACSSDPEDAQNHEQLERFVEMSSRFPHLPTSMANSGGILLGEAWHDDLARPGCALYGVNPGDRDPVPVKPVVRLSAPVIQLRQLDRAQKVGYGGTQSLPAGATLATVAIGYADGVFRHFSHRLSGYVAGHPVPLVGRVTMDMLTFDLSNLPASLIQEDMRIEIMNEQQTVNDLAAIAETIGYEVLTSIGKRVERRYVEWAA